jgi:NDP-sugar pyrophosphorylase family protein
MNMKGTQVLILAAGFGTRLRPLTTDIPKPLLKLNKESILARLIRQTNLIFPASNIYINCSYLAEEISRSLLDLPVRDRPCLIWEERPLGTAVTAMRLYATLHSDMIVIHGDLVLELEGLRKFKKHIEMSQQSTVVTHKRDQSTARSIVQTLDNKVIGIVEINSEKKLEPGIDALVNSGIYYLRSQDLQSVPSPLLGENVSPLIINSIAKRGQLGHCAWIGTRISVDSFATYQDAIRYSESNPEIV